MTYASLFSGCGGADIGLCEAGLKPLWFSEIAEKPSDVLRYRYPDVPNYGDITKLDPETVVAPDVLWMSPPCQDISIAGNQDGLKGERSGLFYEAVRICRTLVGRGTSIVLMEQVPNLRSINDGRDMASVLGCFLDIGARDIGWTLLDTQFAGIPQSRDRIFFVVDFRGQRASQILSFASRLCRDASPRRKTGEGITGTLAAGTRSGGRGSSAEEASQLVPVSSACLTSRTGGRNDLETDTYIPVIHDGRGREDGNSSPTLCTDHAGRPSDQCPVIVTHDSAATLRADMAKTIDQCGSYGVGPTNAVICFQPEQITSKTNRSSVDRGVAPTMPTTPAVIAFDCKSGHGPTGSGVSPTLRAMSHAESHENGGGQVACVRWQQGGGDTEQETAGTLRSEAESNYQFVRAGMQVRRLTPTECERLQGFPDDWTRWGINAKGQKYELADTPRYRMIGNAVSSCWGKQIGERVLEATENEREDTC